MLHRRSEALGFHVHPHMLRHCIVDNWLRSGGSGLDLSRIAGWTPEWLTAMPAIAPMNER
jgi:site-specific recombinase XerC